MLSVLVVGVTAVLGGGPALARPLYFDNFVDLYGIGPGEDLYACGVCHFRWEGTGARNPYGFAIEQQLYIGQPILSAIAVVEANDTDLDGFSNIDEITVHGTLPGYSCDNFASATDPPPNFQSLITPGVPSCLEPMDLLITPDSIAFVTEVGKQSEENLLLRNNGTDFPIEVSAIEFLAGADPTLAFTAPAPPFSIPVGGSAVVEVTFSPVVNIGVLGTLRVTSDDPDEPTMDITVTGLGVTLPLAPAEERSACLRVVDRQVQAYAKRSLLEWERCFLDETRGRACDSGRRDMRILQGADKLRSQVGGSKDKACAGNGLAPVFLGVPNTCGGGCSSIAVNSISSFADCLVCRVDESVVLSLQSAFGVQPPDLPDPAATAAVSSCQKKIAKGVRKAVGKIHKSLGRCELANVTAALPVDCAADLAAKLASLQSKADATVDRCVESTGLLGCPFEMTPSPTCLGDASLEIGSDLVATTFGLDD
jgi:hypothetical protein